MNESQAPIHCHFHSGDRRGSELFHMKASIPFLNIAWSIFYHWVALISSGKISMLLSLVACLLQPFPSFHRHKHRSHVTLKKYWNWKLKQQVLIVDFKGRQRTLQQSQLRASQMDKRFFFSSVLVSRQVKTIKHKKKSWQIKEEIWFELICFGFSKSFSLNVTVWS